MKFSQMVDEGVVPPWNIVPERSEGYPRSNLLPSRQVAHDRVFLCRKVYDSRGRRMLKNPYWGAVTTLKTQGDLRKKSSYCVVMPPKRQLETREYGKSSLKLLLWPRKGLCSQNQEFQQWCARIDCSSGQLFWDFEKQIENEDFLRWNSGKNSISVSKWIYMMTDIYI